MGRKQIRRNPMAGKKKSCGEKKQYPDRQQAQRAAELFMQHQAWASEKAPYPCPYAKDGHWHIGAPLGRR